MKPREFHLFDFPDDTRIFLEDGYREEFFNTAADVLSTSRLEGLRMIAKSVGKSRQMIEIWRYGYSNSKRQCPPLWIIRKLVNILEITNNPEFLPLEIERHVRIIRSHSSTLYIENPRFPVKEDPRIIRVLVHLMGDGSGGRKGNKKENIINRQTPSYWNTNKKLLKQFWEDLKFMGEIKGTKIPKTMENRERITFPLFISEFLKKTYNVKFGTFEARLPKILWKLPSKFATVSIQAFADDEATVGISNITFSSANKGLLHDIRNLILHAISQSNAPKGTKNTVTEIRECRGYYYLRLNRNAAEWFHKNIGFTHPEKKKWLEFDISRPLDMTRWRKKGVTKSLILRLLRKKAMTPKELSYSLKIGQNAVNRHLSGLKDKDLVKRKRKGKTFLWCIK